MSIEGGSQIMEQPVPHGVPNLSTAVGEFLFNPDVWKQGLELVATTGQVMSAALGTTARLAAFSAGAEVAPKTTSVTSVVQPNINPGVEGGR